MDSMQTPIRNRHNQNPVTIPPSPFLKKLGYGTGVAVYKLERSPVANKIQSPWAIKKLLKRNIINTQYGKRLKEEASILRKLDHPNIVGFRAFVKASDNQDCLAMEQCNNSLGDMIEQRNELSLLAYPAKNIMRVALDISEALNYLHTQALFLHCDVKSYNILVKDNFSICKLCDFGVTLPITVHGEINRDKAGKDAEYIGTRLWMAPEILKYPQIITTKADIYSYGLVLWEMLALCPPCVDSYDESMCLTNDLEDLDDSITSESEETIEKMNKSGFGKRPELPAQDFDDSYKYVLEIFHCCTEENPANRPSAQDLTISIPEMNKVLGFD
ncbi:hypothetical protein ILUMI_24378 [Ignelater luminosus]|uniref:Protein kinase domain-containing protein n=1 Tax=Ignelater luminosus TaxID=2038154 RepID=A0A8K0C754_IGNLU|nr:hypothetical protein ILUMI_24378 [Ignelater luminosus]